MLDTVSFFVKKKLLHTEGCHALHTITFSFVELFHGLQAETIRVATPRGAPLEHVEMAIKAFKAETNIDVELVSSGARSTNDQLVITTQWVGSSNPPVDAIIVDVIWSGIFKDYVIDLYSGKSHRFSHKSTSNLFI